VKPILESERLTGRMMKGPPRAKRDGPPVLPMP